MRTQVNAEVMRGVASGGGARSSLNFISWVCLWSLTGKTGCLQAGPPHAWKSSQAGSFLLHVGNLAHDWVTWLLLGSASAWAVLLEGGQRPPSAWSSHLLPLVAILCVFYCSLCDPWTSWTKLLVMMLK